MGWLVLSRPPVSLPEARPLASSWPPRLLTNQLLLQEESRSPIGTGQELSPFVRSEGTRNLLSSSSASFPSSVWFVKSPKISRQISVSSRLPSVPFRKPPRPTSLVFLKTPTCAPS